MSDAQYCKDCKNMNCPESRVNCKYPDAIACDLYRDTPQTLFDRITQSEETLAEKLVFWGFGGWTSHFINFSHYDQSEAIAATVARLKEVCDE